MVPIFYIENAVDPARGPVTHHNLAGNNRYASQVMHMVTITPLTKDGFLNNAISAMNSQGSQTYFYAPSLVASDTPVGEEGAKVTHELSASPSRPGFCDIIQRLLILKDKTGATFKQFRALTLPFSCLARS
jgi:hypothetical protein